MTVARVVCLARAQSKVGIEFMVMDQLRKYLHREGARFRQIWSAKACYYMGKGGEVTGRRREAKIGGSSK
jgi:hypothetical protein